SHESLERLRILIPTTCVGLRYRLHMSLFLEVATMDYHRSRSFSVLSHSLKMVQRTFPSVRTIFTPSSLLIICRYRNINLLSIHYPLRVRVRPCLALS